MSKIDELRTLINVQTHDTQWLMAAAASLNAKPSVLIGGQWTTLFAVRGWGTLQVDANNTLVWGRPDGGPAMADTRETDNVQKAVTFALMAELSLQLKAAGELSYCVPGSPDWRKAKVIFNGKELLGVRMADALLGIIEMYEKDKVTKRFKLDETGESFAVTRVSGNVKVLVEPEAQTFF